MALLRLAGSGEGVSTAGSLEDCVMEYGKLCMRVHMGKNQQSVALSSINLLTMKREQPPPGEQELRIQWFQAGFLGCTESGFRFQ